MPCREDAPHAVGQVTDQTLVQWNPYSPEWRPPMQRTAVNLQCQENSLQANFKTIHAVKMQ
eukprot:6450158-Amphidinium_carterae.1